MTYKNTLISLAMLAFVGISVWLTLITYRPNVEVIAKNDSLPDAFMEDVTAVIMDKQGKPKMIIATPKLTHYTENDTTFMLSPHLTLYRKSPEPWYVTSKHAKATAGIENVNFWDDVVINHPADPNNPATVIKTNTLVVHPSMETAETNDLITLIQPSLVVKAIGMQADMSTGNIKLLSEARGEYVTSS